MNNKPDVTAEVVSELTPGTAPVSEAASGHAAGTQPQEVSSPDHSEIPEAAKTGAQLRGESSPASCEVPGSVTPAGAAPKKTAKKPNIVRRLYDWTLHWADTRWGVLALFVLAFAESSFFPIPPDVLLIACCLGLPKKSFKYALICTAGSVLGACFGYLIGQYAWLNPESATGFTALADWFFNNLFSVEAYRSVEAMYNQWNFWIVFTGGFTPLPFKLITITAGVFDINFVMFLIASIVSRGARFFLVGWLIWKFGPTIKSFIDKHFNWMALAFTVLLIGGFLAIKYI